MQNKDGLCRRCSNIKKAIDCANDIENALATHLDSFRSFYNSIISLDTITIDDIIDAISKINPLPASILPIHLKRATKRNVYPIAIMNTVRLLNGTFNWHISGKPTSIAIIFNQALSNVEVLKEKRWCICNGTKLFFAISAVKICPFCNGASSFSSTSSRIFNAQASFIKINSIQHDKNRALLK